MTSMASIYNSVKVQFPLMKFDAMTLQTTLFHKDNNVRCIQISDKEIAIETNDVERTLEAIKNVRFYEQIRIKHSSNTVTLIKQTRGRVYKVWLG